MAANWIEVWTDGSCKPNPGVGGWGCVILNGGHTHELCGGEAYTTSFRMEMTGIIRALEVIQVPNFFIITTDCKAIVDGIAGRKSLARRSSTNKDLWKRLVGLVDFHNGVQLNWRPGHTTDVHNLRADELARGAMIHASENGAFKQWLS